MYNDRIYSLDIKINIQLYGLAEPCLLFSLPDLLLLLGHNGSIIEEKLRISYVIWLQQRDTSDTLVLKFHLWQSWPVIRQLVYYPKANRYEMDLKSNANCYTDLYSLLCLHQFYLCVTQEHMDIPTKWWLVDSYLQLLDRQRMAIQLPDAKSQFHMCDTLHPWLIRQNTKYRQAVSVEVGVAICIWRLATNLEYRSISHLFAVGLSTCCLITQEIVP